MDTVEVLRGLWTWLARAWRAVRSLGGNTSIAVSQPKPDAFYDLSVRTLNAIKWAAEVLKGDQDDQAKVTAIRVLEGLWVERLAWSVLWFALYDPSERVRQEALGALIRMREQLTKMRKKAIVNVPRPW